MDNIAGYFLLLLAALGVAGASMFWWEHRKKQSVECALYTEIISLRVQAASLAEEIARRHIAAEPFDARFFDLWPLSEPIIYPNTAAASLGLLSRESLGCVGTFHGQLAGARARLARARPVGSFQPTPYRVLSGLVRAHYAVDPWIKALRPTLGDIPGVDPDITTANTLLGEFEEASDEPLAVPYCWVDCAQP